MLELGDMLGVTIESMPWQGAHRLPIFMEEAYHFRAVTLDQTACVFAAPRGEMPDVRQVAAQFERIASLAQVPIVLQLSGLSGERRKALMAARIPFVAKEQIYLPFMGIALQEKLYAEPKSREKLMPSAQLLLFAYLYQPSNVLYLSGMAEKLGVSAMQITRAARQLETLNLAALSKDGVRVVMHGKTNHSALFAEAKRSLLDPVRDTIYVEPDDTIWALPIAGPDALAQHSMLSAMPIPVRAFYSKTEKLQGESRPTDTSRQIPVEIWKYPPTQLSKTPGIADPLSVIASLPDEALNDPRVGAAVDEIFEGLWGER
ncbi:MAG: hypothetical protein LBN04_11745 [Oscillospiraceae bacterium]|nr:hypothetical protein [Oscillospiraceae bacterium]